MVVTFVPPVMNELEGKADDVWTDPRLVADPWIDHGDRDVHRATEVLHVAEPRHLHDAHTMGPVCIFCARRATLAVRTVNDAHRHDAWASGDRPDGWDRPDDPEGRR